MLVHIFQKTCVHLLLLYRAMFAVITLGLPPSLSLLFLGSLRDHIASAYQGLGLGSSALGQDGT